METEAGETETVSAVRLVLLSLMLLRAGVFTLPLLSPVFTLFCSETGWLLFHKIFLEFFSCHVSVLFRCRSATITFVLR